MTLHHILEHVTSGHDLVTACQDRVCFSAVFEMSPDAKVLKTFFTKAGP